MKKTRYKLNITRRGKNSLVIVLCLFFFSAITPPIIAQVASFDNLGRVGIAHPTSEQNPQILSQQARELYQQGSFTKAATLWEETARIFASAGDILNQGMALSNLSLTYQKLGSWEQAETAINQSLELLKNTEISDNQQRILAQSFDIQGQLQRETGKSADALDSWQQADNIYQQLGDLEAGNQTKINQAQALKDLGLYPRACQTLLSVVTSDLNLKNCDDFSQITSEQLQGNLDKIAQKENTATTVITLRNIGDILRYTGQLEQSKQILETSLTLAETLESPTEIAASYLSLGNANQALAVGETIRDFRIKYQNQAENAFNQAKNIAPSLALQQQAQLNQLSLLIQLEKWSAASQLGTTLQNQIVQLTPSRTKINAQINLAHSLIELLAKAPANEIQLPTKGEIEQLLTEANSQARTFGDDRFAAYSLGNLGRLDEITGELSTAEEYTKQALNLLSNFDSLDVAYQYFWQLGRIYNSREEIPLAITAYTKAYDALQYLRGDLATINPEVQFSFRDQVEPVYRELVALDLEYARTLKEENQEQESKTQLIQARNVIESLQIAQLNNFFREACIEGNPQQIDNLDSNTAVIYPIILSDKLEILLSLPDKSITPYSTNKSASEVKELAEKIRNSLLSADSLMEGNLPLYQQAYDWMIRPLKPQLDKAQVKTIAFVLDGELRNIPMSVLHDGEKYLVEEYALALTPGLQLLNPKPIADVSLDALTAGLSEIPEAYQQDFNSLPKVPEELAEIRRSLGLSQDSLLNSQFTKSALKQEITLTDSPIIHLATHAKFSSDAKNTFILAWDGEINIKQLDDLLRDDTFRRKQAIELLVLSACETASGDPRATLGLAGVAVQSGARSTLATLWSVVDESTARVMREFYSQLTKSDLKTSNKASALRQAQLSLINDEKFSHPHFWAPFILVGNWQ